MSVIENGAEQISSDEAKAGLEAAFASIAGRIAGLRDEETPAPVNETQVASPAPAPLEAVAETIEPEPAQEVAQASTSSLSTDAEALTAEAALAQADAALEEIEAAEAVELTADAADAHDEAVLNMIAMEMGAPDPIDDEIFEPAVDQAQLAEPPPGAPEMIAQAPEPMAIPVKPPVQPPPQPAIEAAPETALEISLGSSIIASGIVRKPMVPANDPLAPIRRMSQAEKIAFFS